MTDVETTVTTTRAGAVATLTLDPAQALNALTHEMLAELGAALEALSADSSVRVIVLTGEGRAFSAGVDLKALAAGRVDGGSVSDLLNDNARNAIRLLTTIPQAVIARVNGFCFTGALELALACDLIVVADEAKLGDTHAKWGLRPTWGMSQRLIRARRRGAGSRPVVHGPHVLGSGGRGVGPGGAAPSRWPISTPPSPTSRHPSSRTAPAPSPPTRTSTAGRSTSASRTA